MLSKKEYLQPFLDGRSGVGWFENRVKRFGKASKILYGVVVQDGLCRLIQALQLFFFGR